MSKCTCGFDGDPTCPLHGPLGMAQAEATPYISVGGKDLGFAIGWPKDNPKHIQAQKEGKDPLEWLVWGVLASEARVLRHGGVKYGTRNWRIDKILASTYEGAMMRHFIAWASGEDIDPDSGEPHLSHLRACCAVVMDAQEHDTLIDDRSRQESKDG